MQVIALISLILLSAATSFKVSHLAKIIIDSENLLRKERDEDLYSRDARQNIINDKTHRRDKRLRMIDVRAFEAVSDAFVGGTVGVMSVAFILELRKVSDSRLDGCPYCLGNGEILCGSCYGNPLGVGSSNAMCTLCNGRGLIQCINCKGDGRITPILLQSKAIRDPDYSNPQLQERNKK